MAIDDRTRAFEGRVAVVTGAATGLGLGIAKALRDHGATVVLNDLSQDDLERAAAELGLEGPALHLIDGDVSDENDISRLVQAAEKLGQFDILVNNAGIQVVKPLVEHTTDEWDRIIAVNLRGVFLAVREALPGMMRRGHGAIVNLASIAAFHTTTPHVAYAASKAAVVALTRDAAYEAAPFGIRINAIAPGPIETPMTRRIDASTRDDITRAIPVGRWGDPADIGAAVAYLVSEDAGFVTGATLPVSGGADLRLAY